MAFGPATQHCGSTDYVWQIRRSFQGGEGWQFAMSQAANPRPLRALRRRRADAMQQLGGEVSQMLARLPRVFGPVGAWAWRKTARCLQGPDAGHRLLEAAMLLVLAQPAVVLLVLGRHGVLHVDDHPERLGESHLGVALA